MIRKYFFCLAGYLSASLNTSNLSLEDLIGELPFVEVQEDVNKNSRENLKAMIQSRLNSTVIDDEEILKLSKKTHLSEKGYQIYREKEGLLVIHDRHSIFNALYPFFFSAFEKRTDEKQKSSQYLAQTLKFCIDEHPTFCLAENFKIYDMGIGSGFFLSQLLQSGREALPRGKKFFAYGVDNKAEFVIQSIKNIEKIADQISIAKGDLHEDTSLYRHLNGQLALHELLYDINFILFSHVGYYIKDSLEMERIIQKMLQLTSRTPSPIFCFIHNSVDTVIEQMLTQKEFNFLKPRRTDVNSFLCLALQNSKVPFLEFSFEPKIYFPILNDEQWKELSFFLLSVSKNDFQKEIEGINRLSSDVQEVWKIMVLWSQDLFAALQKQEKELLIEGFKDLINKYPGGIPIPNNVILSSVEKILLNKLKDKMKN